MMRGLATQAEPLRTRTTLEIKEEIRRKNGVPLPSRHNLFGPVAIDYAANYGKPTKFNTGIVEHLIKFWRDNRDKYNFAVTTEGKMKEAEERMQMMREEMLRRENFKFDPLKVYPPGSWEDDRQQYLAYWEGIDLRTIRIKAKLTQMEAMRALVRELPGNKDTIQEDKEMDMDAHIEALVSNLLAHVTKGDDKLRKHVRFAKSCEVRIIEPTQEHTNDQGVHKGKGIDKEDDIVDNGKKIDKGKSVVILSSDDDTNDSWGDDELILGCDLD
ncbi:hypothetical protein HU200_027423 [Digitaria exilis]|uniref:Uncharacterized protein n=1 Tax=Digitaria exilis TaxID=1010633 RepID=A0A835ETG5_9POAL|nr:hypothetical protein HU200_027423 [Digitaria exilis]